LPSTRLAFRTRACVVRSRRGPPDRPPRIGPRRAPGPSGPGRCWSWPPRLRPRCGPAGSESRRKPGSAWSPRCRASGPRCIWTLPSPSRRRGLRRVRAARLAGHRAHGQRPDAPVRQAVGDLLVRARDGRAGRLPPDGSGRSGAGAVAHHYRRVLPACLPTCRSWSWDRAGAHAARQPQSRWATDPQDRRRLRSLPGPARTRQDRPRTKAHPRRRYHWPRPVLLGTRKAPQQDHDATAAAPSLSGIGQARLAASRLTAAGKPVFRRALRSEGIRGSNQPGPERPGTHDQCRTGRRSSAPGQARQRRGVILILHRRSCSWPPRLVAIVQRDATGRARPAAETA